MIKYRTSFNRLEKIEIEKETEKTVVINGRRENKRSDWYNYFDTLEEAKNFLISGIENKINSLKQKLEEVKKI